MYPVMLPHVLGNAVTKHVFSLLERYAQFPDEHRVLAVLVVGDFLPVGIVLGPDKPAVARVKTESIRKIVLKLELGIDLTLARRCMRDARAALLQDKRYAVMTVYFDVDPL